MDKLEPQSQRLRIGGLSAAWLRTSLVVVIDILWCKGLAPAFVILALLVTAIAYQLPVAGRESLAARPAPLGLNGVYPPEPSAQNAQRWTSEQARITVPGVGSGPLVVRLRIFGGAEPGAGRRLSIGTPGQPLFEADLRPDWQELQLHLPCGVADRASGDLTLIIATTTFTLPPDERALGVALAWIEVRSASAAAQLPPPGRTAQLAMVLLLSLWTLRLAGLPSRLAVLPVTLLLLISGALLAGWPDGALGARMQAAIGLSLLVRVLPLTLLLALLVRLVTLRIVPRTAGQFAPAMLRLAVLVIFTLRLGGTFHPQFIPVDHGLRANQLLLIAEGRVQQVQVQLEQQYEWGTREPVPYSLLTYYMLLPLATGGRPLFALITAVKVATALFEASIPLLLLALLRGGPQRLAGAAWAGMVYAALPVGYLFFHDGSFPTTIGVWLTLVALVGVRWLVELYSVAPLGQGVNARAGGGWPILLVRGGLAAFGLALAIGAYVTHIAFVPFLGLTLGVSLAWLGGDAGRRASRPLLLSVALGLLLGWTLVYGSYTLTLVQRTIPSYLSLIFSNGSVGRNADAFFGTPLNSFGEHMAAHFRVWPVLLATAALAALVSSWRERFVTHLGLAYAILLLATSLAERWFGLWNKHMVFVAPSVALIAGIGLAWLWRRGRAGRLVCVLLLALLFWESLTAWSNRVLWYQLPPGAL